MMFPVRTSRVSLDPPTLLEAYSRGLFPMADPRGRIQFYCADPRGVLPLDGLRVPRTLRSTLRRMPEQGGFEIRFNHSFRQVMEACSERRVDGTWISPKLVDAYEALHRIGHAHSVETWRDGKLVGGLYGVSLQAAFFGESMFHRESNASKVALVHLVERLRQRGYELLDTQMTTDLTEQFGAVEIDIHEYGRRLTKAMERECVFGDVLSQ